MDVPYCLVELMANAFDEETIAGRVPRVQQVNYDPVAKTLTITNSGRSLQRKDFKTGYHDDKEQSGEHEMKSANAKQKHKRKYIPSGKSSLGDFAVLGKHGEGMKVR